MIELFQKLNQIFILTQQAYFFSPSTFTLTISNQWSTIQAQPLNCKISKFHDAELNFPL